MKKPPSIWRIELFIQIDHNHMGRDFLFPSGIEFGILKCIAIPGVEIFTRLVEFAIFGHDHQTAFTAQLAFHGQVVDLIRPKIALLQFCLKVFGKNVGIVAVVSANDFEDDPASRSH